MVVSAGSFNEYHKGSFSKYTPEECTKFFRSDSKACTYPYTNDGGIPFKKDAIERAQARREICEFCTDAVNPFDSQTELTFKKALMLVDESKTNPQLQQKLTKNGKETLANGILNYIESKVQQLEAEGLPQWQLETMSGGKIARKSRKSARKVVRKSRKVAKSRKSTKRSKSRKARKSSRRMRY